MKELFLPVISLFLLLCARAEAVNMIYTVCETTTDLSNLTSDLPTVKGLGMDVVMPYSHTAGSNSWPVDSDYATMLNTLIPAAHAAGLSIMVDLLRYTRDEQYWGGAANTPNIGGLTTIVNAVKNTPSLYGYYIADESSIYTENSAATQSIHDVIMALDPNHEILIVQNSPVRTSSGQPGGQTPYTTTDHTIYGIDDYPLLLWAPNTYFYLNDVVFPSAGRGSSGYAYKAVAASNNNNNGVLNGETGATEPQWPTCTPGCTTSCQVVDTHDPGNGVTWQCTGSGVVGQSIVPYLSLQTNLTTDVTSINAVGGSSDKLLFVMEAFGSGGTVLPLPQELVDMATAAGLAGAAKNGIAFWIWSWGSAGGGNDTGIKENLSSWGPAIREITGVNNDSPGPGAAPTAGGGGGGGGCFVATAAYGSSFHPHVATLRNFRDAFLLSNTTGRAFVDWYYRVSPPIADSIRTSEALKAGVRIALLPAVGFGALCLKIGFLSGLLIALLIAGTLVIASRRGFRHVRRRG